jgi:hypothetical protein
MRTRVSLDPDVAAKLRALAHERGTSFKEILNSTLRPGLAEQAGPAARPYRLKPRRMGLGPGVDITHALRLSSDSLRILGVFARLPLRRVDVAA